MGKFELADCSLNRLLSTHYYATRCSVAGFSPPASDFSGGDPTYSSGQGLIETLCENGDGEVHSRPVMAELIPLVLSFSVSIWPHVRHERGGRADLW